MTINYVAERFVQGRPMKGAYMSVDEVDGKTTLSYRYGGTTEGLIAEITNRKENGDFTLFLHPRHHSWGKTSHNNRIWGVLIAIGGDYQNMRYNSFVRYSIIVHDKKLDIDYHLQDRPIKFNYKGGNLVIDYAELESNAHPKEEVKIVEPSDNNNIKNEVERLTNILATV